MSLAKPCDKLTPSDLEKFPVWTFDLGNEGVSGRDETWMVPVKKLPVTTLSNCGCKANATLACGRKVDAMVWSVDLKSIRQTQQFIAISFWFKTKRWNLSRYYELERPFVDEKGFRETHAPADLALKLGLEINEVFPISYDLSRYAVGIPETVRGQILVEPIEKLDLKQRIALSLE